MISERLRNRIPEFGPLSDFHHEVLEAADDIDALVGAAERGRYYVDAAVREDGGIENCDVGYRVDIEAIDAALAMVRRP